MKKETPTLGKKRINDLVLLSANDEYKADMSNLLRKYNLSSKNELLLDGKKELEFVQDPKSIEMVRDYIELMNKYGITWLYYMLMPYIVEKGYFSILASGEQMKFDINEATKYVISCSGINVVENEKEFVTVKIPKDATTKDVKEMWLKLKNDSGEKARSKKTSKNQKRDLEISRLRTKGLTGEEVAKKINTNPKYANQKITYQEVYRIDSRIKARAKKNMPNKES